MSSSGEYLFDLDGTLAEYYGWGDGSIGRPIAPMVERVVEHLSNGETVKIFTARAYSGDQDQIDLVKAWCKEHIGVELEVTNEKSYATVMIYDDRAVQVEMNTGRIIADTDPPKGYEDLVKAAERFVLKFEIGLASSKESYSQFKAALELIK